MPAWYWQEGGGLVDTLHYTTQHFTTLHYTTLHYTTQHYTTPGKDGLAFLTNGLGWAGLAFFKTNGLGRAGLGQAGAQ